MSPRGTLARVIPSPGHDQTEDMETLPQTATSPGAARPRERPAAAGTAPRRARLPAALPLARHAGFAVVVGVAAVLNTHSLAKNGYANIFYSAGVKSMLRSLHNFVFVSFDPGGLITIDKPPLALWLQAASAKVFGFSPLSLLMPEALAGVLAVAAARTSSSRGASGRWRRSPAPSRSPCARRSWPSRGTTASTRC